MHVHSRGKRLRTTFCVILIIVLLTTFSSSVIQVRAHSRPFLSAWTSVTPTIDGVVDTATEWSMADKQLFTLGGNYSGEIYVMNDDANLYLAVRITDDDFGTTGADYDAVSFSFDNDHDGAGPEEGDDTLICISNNFGAFDQFHNLTSGTTWDSLYGGTVDGAVAATGNGSINSFEFTHPLNSTDLAHDFSLKPGRIVGFTTGYIDNRTWVGYWPTNPGFPQSHSRFHDIIIASPNSIYQGNLILRHNTTLIIEDRQFDINGSIIVEENATLILRNAAVNFTQTSQYQYGVIFQNPVNGKPRLQSENATISSDYDFFISFYGNSSADAYELNFPIGTLEACDSSRMSILNSTIKELSCQDNSVVNVSNSEINVVCKAWANSSVNLSNCKIASLKLYESSTVTISDSSIGTWLEIQPSSVNCSIVDLAKGFTSFWNYLLNCSVVMGAEGYAPNLTVRDTTISNWYFIFRGSSNATIYNSSLVYLDCTGLATVDVMNSNIQGIYAYQTSNMNIANSTLMFIFGYGSCQVNILNMNISSMQSRHSSRFWLTNSTSDAYDVGDQSEVCVSWYLDVHATDSIDQNVPSANVTAYYPNATIAESKLTGVNGWARLTLLEKMMNATGEYPVGNYNVEATYGIHSDATTVNMTENQQAMLILESFIIPEFSSLLTLPLFMTLTLVVAFLYNRKRFQ